MKNLLAFLAAAVLVFVGVGWYLNWFHVLSSPADSGHKAYRIDFDADKIGADVHKGEQKVVDAIEKARAEAEAHKAAADQKGDADSTDGKKSE
jgi:hypothetical protein